MNILHYLSGIAGRVKLLVTSDAKWPLLLLVVVSLAHFPAAALFLESWTTPGDRYAHGVLLLLVVIVLLSRFNGCLVRHSPLYTAITLLALLALSALCWLAILLDVSLVQMVLLPILMAVGAFVLFERAIAIRLTPVFLYLLLTTPMWNPANEVLKSITVVMSSGLLSLLMVPVHVVDFYIAIPGGLFEVEDGCSGFKYFISSLSLMSLLLLVGEGSYRRKAVLFVFGILLALAANWVRVATVVVVGHVYGLDHPLVTDHDNLGWFIYGLMLALFFWIGKPAIHSFSLTFDVVPSSNPPALGMLLKGLVLCLPLSVVLMAMALLPATATQETRLVFQPGKFWRVDAAPGGLWRPDFPNARLQQIQTFISARDASVASVHWYEHAILGMNKAFLNFEYSWAPDGWEVISDLPAVTVAGIPFAQMIVADTRSNAKHLVLYAYRVDDQFTLSRLTVKRLRLQALLDQRGSAGVLVFDMPCQQADCESSAVKMNRLIELGRTQFQ